MRAAIVALAASSALTLASPAQAAEGVRCGFYGVDPGAPVDAGEVILDARHAEALARSGAGAARVEFRLDGAEAWDEEKRAEYDAIVDAVIAAGLEPVGLLSHRAARGGQSRWNDDPDGDGNNAYVEEFAGAAEALMSRFAGRVRRWEIWSQPNCFEDPDYALDPMNAGCTYILPRVLAQILGQIRARNEGLFNVDELSLITGGLLVAEDLAAPTSGADYLRELYDQPVWDALEARYGQRYPWSHLGYQMFIQPLGEVDEVAIAGALDEGRAIAEQHGDSSELFITGMAWAANVVGEELQAANLRTSFEFLATRRDVAGAIWASYRDAPLADLSYGLVGQNDAPRLALAALRDAAAGCEREDGGGAGSGPGASGSSGGSIGTSAPPVGDGLSGRPIDGKRRESSCSYAAGAPRGGGGARPDAGWLALLVVVGAVARSRGSARRSRRVI
ncbi:hypothetical protein SOCEGT47_000670 [Sorangium cellulosum]|uniref:Uncharacterized protein n=1 Tax=Sorangium cellulosum TaxID=56 RepID=A0A4P2PSR7_SORCE|nr:hypothetical protein [Sorangium cellulosum]AUX19615.1 hypothetical protein SOCEGT47_000670 [Sorangium cellulosum]